MPDDRGSPAVTPGETASDSWGNRSGGWQPENLPQGAAKAAETVRASIASSGDAGAALAALRLRATVDAAAVATADDTALAAAAVATAVAARGGRSSADSGKRSTSA
jgi:hypothetical protein